MLKQIHIVITVLFLAGCTHLQAQTISGVSAQQNGNAIDVSYLFDYPEKYLSGTTLFVSGDNGKTWEGPLENVEFDNTKSESSGIETIQWQDPQKALAIGDQLIFDVRVSLPAEKEYDTEVMLNIGNTGTLCIDGDGFGAVSQGDIIVLDNYIKKGRHVFSIGALEQKVKIHSGINNINLTYCPPTVTDIDGNIYPTVKIGRQCWMQENLKVTHYPNGNAIPYITDNEEWAVLIDNNTDDAYCYSDNNTNSEYGALYTYAAAIGDNWQRDNTEGQGICPDGWHLPTDEEWKELVDYLGGPDIAGGKMKEEGTTHWNHPNVSATNVSGFTALPGGSRNNVKGFLFYVCNVGYYWSATENSINFVWGRFLNYTHAIVYRQNYSKSTGSSVRCIRGIHPDIFNETTILVDPKLSLKSCLIEYSGKGTCCFMIDNFNDFPNELFQTLPNFSPCDDNTSSSRTWVEIYDSNDILLQRYCDFNSSNDLGIIHLFLKENETPPESFYVVLFDREKNIKYKSNLVPIR